jgi:hypothetical protein
VIGDAFVCSSCLGHSHGPQQPSQAAYGLLFSPISRTLVRQKALFRPKQAESSTSKTSLTCLVTMWRGSAGHDVRNPYTRHPLCTQPTILVYDILSSEAGIPIIHWLGERDHSHLARLCTGPLRSPHRQAILRFLHNSPSPQSIPAILQATSYDEEAGRKMLVRMKMAGELVSPARGLYTTATHPCLAHDSAHPHPDTPESSVPPVPLVPNLDNHTAAAPPATETSCATGAPLRMEARLPEDTVGEVSKDGERSDAPLLRPTDARCRRLNG